ncbi:MAG TPA: hypothetical protein VF655_04070 [Allosphingosinicella sp.]
MERELIRRNPDAQIDLVDLFALSARHSPHWRRRDVLLEQANRKIGRFVRPMINGRDVTGDIKLRPKDIPPVLNDLGRLRGYKVGGAAVGLAVLSSITSATTVQEPGTHAQYGAVLPMAWRSAYYSLQAAEVLRDRGYDEIYTFNGRHCYSRPFCDLMGAGARVWRYEQGATGASFVMADSSIHEPDTVARLIRSHPYERAAGEEFYLARLRRAPGDAVNFYVSQQVQGLLPDGAVPGEFVAFFTSSSDEFIAISDTPGFGSFRSQFDAAISIARAAEGAGKRFVLRLHPHLQYKHASWRREWDFAQLTELGAIVIHPGDQADSYAIASAAHCVFTCGSTVGFECTFRGIPNADVGEWVGAKLGAMPHVMNEVEVAAFIAAPALPDDALEGALLYGSYIRRAGTALPELDIGRHPHYARIDGKVVDPLRYGFQRTRDVLTRDRAGAAGVLNGKVMIDPHLADRAKREFNG